MSQTYDFDSAFRDWQDSASQSIGTTDKSPDDAARAFQLNKVSGMPASLIAEDPEPFEATVRRRLSAEILQDNMPLTAFTNSHPLHPPLIKDDLANLNDVSEAWNKLDWKPYGELFSGHADMKKAATDNDPMAFEAAAQRIARGVRSPARQNAEVPLSGFNLAAYKTLVGFGMVFNPFTMAVWGSQAAKDAVERARTGQLHQELSEGNLSTGTIADAFAISQLAPISGLRVGPPKGLELHEGEILPPGPRPGQQGLPEPPLPPGPPTIEGEAVPSGQLQYELSPEWVAEAQRLKPWADAGVEPLPTISTLGDFAKEHQATIEQDALKEALDAAEKTDLKARSPEKFEEFLLHHPDVTVSIDPRVMLEKPEAFKWLPPPETMAKIEVPGAEFLSKFDKGNWNDVKDDVSLGGLTKNEVKELKETPSEPIVGDNLDQIRQAAGLTVYHGSPADFTAFDSAFNRTGEGINMIAEGHYLAENPNVAGEYQKNLGARGLPQEQAAAAVALRDMSREEAITWYRQKEERLKAEGRMSNKYISDEYSRVRQLLESGWEPPKGNLYTARILQPKEAFLDWDKKLSEQSPQVQEALKKIENIKTGTPDPRGEEIHRLAELAALDKTGADVLREAGIPGIKYLDQGSRTEGKGTHNYVVFSDKDLEITHKNGEPLSKAEAETLKREVLQRARGAGTFRSGKFRLDRPVRTAKMNLRTDADILEAGLDKALPDRGPQAVFAKGSDMGVEQKMFERLLKRVEAQTNGDAKWRQRRAEAQAKLERSIAWQELRKQLEPEVRAEMENLGLVGAWNRLRKDKLDPMYVRPVERADIPELVGGHLQPDQAAGMFGFGSGQEMIDALRELASMGKGKGDIVDRLVNQRLDDMVRSQLGKTPLELLDEELEHSVSLTTMEMLHEKILLMAQRLGLEGLPISKTAMDWGALVNLEKEPFRNSSAMKKMQEVVVSAKRIQRFLSEGKDREAIVELQNQYQLAAQVKILTEVAKEAKGFDRAAKRFEPREVKKFPIEFTNFIQQILMFVGEKVERSPQDLANHIRLMAENQGGAKNLDEFITDLTDVKGLNVPIAEFLRTGPPKQLKDMNIGEARAVFESVKTLVHHGRQEGMISQAGKEIDLRDLLDMVIDDLKRLGPAKEAPPVPTKTWQMFHYARVLYEANITAERTFYRWSRGNPRGVAMQWLIRPMNAAGYYEMELIKRFDKVMKDIGPIADPNSKVKNDLFRSPDTNQFIPMTRLTAHAVLANAGNSSNLIKMAEGYKILDQNGKANTQAIMNWLQRELKVEDFDRAQRIGDEIHEPLKALADEMAVRESDVPAENVPLEGFNAFGKQYKGWYQRLMPHYAWKGKPQIGAFTIELPGYLRAATPRRYEKARTAAQYPISLDYGRVLNTSITEMIHDIAFREPVRQLAKALRDKAFQEAIRLYDGQAVVGKLQEYAISMSNVRTPQPEWLQAINDFAAHYQQHIVGNTLNFNLPTVAKHGPTALLRSIVDAGPAEFLWAATQLLASPLPIMDRNIAFVNKHSREIPMRGDFWEYNIQGTTQKVTGQKGRITSFLDLWNRVGRSPVAFSDMLSAKIEWLAVYNKAFRKTGDHDAAVELSDDYVVRTHGSANPARKAAIMTGQPITKMFTAYMNYFSTLAQLFDESAWRAKYGAQKLKEGEVTQSFKQFWASAYPFVTALVIFGAVEQYVEWAFKGEDPESLIQSLHRGALHPKAKRGWGGQTLKFLALGASSPYPLIRDIVYGMETSGEFALGLASSGLFTFWQGLVAASKWIDSITHDRYIPPKTKSTMIERMLVGTGIVTRGFPSAPIGRGIANAHRISTGQENPQTGWDLIRLLAGGKHK